MHVGVCCSLTTRHENRRNTNRTTNLVSPCSSLCKESTPGRGPRTCICDSAEVTDCELAVISVSRLGECSWLCSVFLSLSSDRSSLIIVSFDVAPNLLGWTGTNVLVLLLPGCLLLNLTPRLKRSVNTLNVPTMNPVHKNNRLTTSYNERWVKIEQLKNRQQGYAAKQSNFCSLNR